MIRKTFLSGHMRSISMSMLKVLHIKSPKILTKSRKSWNHFQNKEKGGLEVLREFGHNEEEEHANEDPGVNSDNEEDDEFKVWQTRLHLLKSCWIQSIILTDHFFIPVRDDQPAQSSAFNQPKGRRTFSPNSTRSCLRFIFEVQHAVPPKPPGDVEHLEDVFRKIESGGKPGVGC